MNNAVAIEDRQAFLMWFGSNHEFKEPQALDLLRFFLARPQELRRLHVIDDCSYLRPLIIISTADQEQPGLLYQTKTGTISDPSTILTDLALTDGLVYLVPFLPNRSYCTPFLQVREDNVNAVDALASVLQDLEISHLVSGSALAVKRAEIMLLVDQALERLDRNAFSALAGLLKKLPSEPGTPPERE